MPLPTKWKSLSHVRLFATPWTVARQAPLSIELSRQEYWSGLPFPSPGDLSNPGIEPSSLELHTNSFFTVWATREAQDTWMLGMSGVFCAHYGTGSWFSSAIKITRLHCCWREPAPQKKSSIHRTKRHSEDSNFKSALIFWFSRIPLNVWLIWLYLWLIGSWTLTYIRNIWGAC